MQILHKITQSLHRIIIPEDSVKYSNINEMYYAFSCEQEKYNRKCICVYTGIYCMEGFIIHILSLPWAVTFVYTLRL